MTVKAIETTYKGYRFRSRTEARWAVFMDHAGITWKYEHQGYVLDGEPYLPDFLIYPDTEYQTWLEIKGKFPDGDEVRKARALARETGIRTYLYFGPIEMPGPGLTEAITNWVKYFANLISQPHWDDEYGWLTRQSDMFAWESELVPTAYRFDPDGRIEREPKTGFWWWADCPHCGRVILKMHGMSGWCPTLPDPGGSALPPELEAAPLFAHETERLQRAYRAAKSARFEHGESPEPPPGPAPISDAARSVIDDLRSGGAA
jgi:hypothetical protein